MRARIVTYGLVGLLAVCAVAQVEWWPLSAFKLFSRARTASTTSWQVALVDDAGLEHVIAFRRLPRGYRGAHRLAADLPGMSTTRRQAVCRAWASAGGRTLGIAPTEVRVYRVEGRLSPGGGPASVVSRTLTTTCPAAGP